MDDFRLFAVTPDERRVAAIDITEPVTSEKIARARAVLRDMALLNTDYQIPPDEIAIKSSVETELQF